MELAEQKAAMRQHMRAERKAITPAARKAYEDDIAERLYSLPAIRKARTIGVYSACGSEISVNDLVRALRLLEEPITIAYPTIAGEGIMHFARVAAGEKPAFLADPLAITDFHDLGSAFVDAKELDVIIVPGLAFDESGRRLGQGGGYYDRYLELVRGDCLSIGVGFDEQVVESIPCGVHDRRVNYVVTPSRTIAPAK